MEYRYSGDVKKLIPNGWKFYKLYANRYKAYNKRNIWMFVISKMRIEINNVRHNETLIDFILENRSKPKKFWEHKSSHELFRNLMIPVWTLFEGDILSTTDMRHRRTQARLSNPSGLCENMTSFDIHLPLVETIYELQDLGQIVKI